MLCTASDISALTPEQLRELVASLQKDIVSREKHVTALEQNVALLEKEVKAEHEKRCKAESVIYGHSVKPLKKICLLLKRQCESFPVKQVPTGTC